MFKNFFFFLWDIALTFFFKDLWGVFRTKSEEEVNFSNVVDAQIEQDLAEVCISTP